MEITVEVFLLRIVDTYSSDEYQAIYDMLFFFW